MIGVTDLGLFIISGIILNILPGPDSLYIAMRSAKGGFKAGSVASFGIGAGTIVHILAAAFGLSALLAASATGFMIVKYIGVAYLLYLGLTMILSRPSKTSTKPSDSLAISCPSPTSYGLIFKQGFLTNVLNPKVALFFLAFVPQFITADAPNKALTFILLGLIFNINGIIYCHFLAWFSTKVAQKVKGSPRFIRYLTKGAGALFAYFAVKLALTELK